MLACSFKTIRLFLLLACLICAASQAQRTNQTSTHERDGANLKGYDNVPSIDNKDEESGTLVVGGFEAPYGKYRYTVNLRESRTSPSFCGGALIAPRFVLTAAHCTEAPIKWVSVGSHFNEGDEDGEIFLVKKVTVHPQYNEENIANDLAILELKQASTTIEPVYLASDATMRKLSRNPRANILTLHGWGRTSYPGNESPVLKELDLKFVDSKKCALALRNVPNVDISSALCAGGITGEASCHGDSGGPLVLNKDDERPTLVGTVSWGIPCAKGNPDVYASVARGKDFIDAVSQGHEWN